MGAKSCLTKPMVFQKVINAHGVSTRTQVQAYSCTVVRLWSSTHDARAGCITYVIDGNAVASAQSAASS